MSSSSLGDRIPSGERLYTLVGVGVIAAVLLGSALFVALFIVPALQDREGLAAQLSTAEQELAQAQMAQGQTPEELNQQIADARATLDESAGAFLSESEAAAVLNRLYEYADGSGVEIVVLQSEPVSEEEKRDAYDANAFQVQAEGSVRDLTTFVARIEEATLEGFVITNVSIVEGERLPVLTMGVVLYTSPYASGSSEPPVSVTPTAPVDLVRLEEDLEEAWEDENWAEAIAIIEQILVIDPFRDDMLERLYVARVGYGYQLLAAGDRAAAATQFSLALEIEPSGEQALAGLEQAAATPSPTQTAEQQLERQLDVAWAAEDWEKAMSLIEQILAISPGRGDMVEKLYAAHVNYGYQLMGEGKLDEAKEQFILALDVKPDGGEAQAGLRALSGGTIAPTPAGGYVIHIVQPGETLYRIAMRYGVTVEAVRAANGLTSNIIYVGQRLRIPVQ